MGELSEIRGNINKRSIVLFALFMFTFSGILCLYIWNTVLVVRDGSKVGATPLTLPFMEQSRPFFWITFTQGWSFFTKSPRDETFYIYEYENDSWKDKFLGPSSALHNLIGIKRAMRAQGVEFGKLAAFIDKWQPCKGSHKECLDSYGGFEKALTIDNPTRAPLLCGQLGFVVQKPVPWAWRHFKEKAVNELTFVLAKVECQI